MNEIAALNKMKSALRKFGPASGSEVAMPIIVTTGGTLDKVHDPITETLIFSENSHIEQILEQARIRGVEHYSIMCKDSADMTESDRQEILDFILKTPHQKIILTHGTTSMVESAKFIKDSVLEAGKVVILTGALRPYSLMNSDASFNIGCAMGAAHSLEAGTYIAMNGQIFTPDQVRKNTQTGYFEKID